MPPRGVKSSRRARQYEHIKESEQKRGRSPRRAKQIAAATVNKERRQAGETKNASSGSRKTVRKSAGGRKKSSSGSARTRKSASRSGAAKKR